MVVDWRLQDLRELYNTPGSSSWRCRDPRALSSGYIYVGELERAYYEPRGPGQVRADGRLAAWTWPTANGPVTIYRVRGCGARQVAGPWRRNAVALAALVAASRQDLGSQRSVKAEGPARRHRANPGRGRSEPTSTLMLDGPVG